MKKKLLVSASVVIIVFAAVAAMILIPTRADAGMYSAKNENKAEIYDGMYAVNLVFKEDSSGYISLSDASRKSVDVIEFSGHSVFLNKITFKISSVKSNYSLPEKIEFDFSQKDGFVILDNCTYEYIRQFV